MIKTIPTVATKVSAWFERINITYDEEFPSVLADNLSKFLKSILVTILSLLHNITFTSTVNDLATGIQKLLVFLTYIQEELTTVLF
jgi:hypothetical protein